jgi:hypothetical protein
MNLDSVEQFLSRLPVRNLHNTNYAVGRMVPFSANANQRRALTLYKKRLASKLPLWVICVKSRRVGFSALSEGLLYAHCASKATARALIVAHQYKSSIALFETPLGFVDAMPFSLPTPTKSRIVFPHHAGDSFLSITTAGSVAGGRGMTLSALHLSEAAHFKSQDSFTSLLPAVSNQDPDSILIIESTANGKEFEGETFYEYWVAATEGRNEFLPVFLSWLDDPACVGDPDDALDAPATDMEKELMAAPYRATRAQIAWMRSTLDTLCHGLEDVFMQEYPWDASVAFLSTGDPAFTRAELSYMRSTLADPIATGHIVADRNGQYWSARYEPARGGWEIYEHPDGESWYYIGGDAARGVEHGDFASAYCWNGHTGACAARYSERVDPETFASLLNAAGRYYSAGTHPAMLNVELTGNLGLWSQKLLRDVYYYPNLYVWRGRDDRKKESGAKSSLGWDTSYRTREMMFVAFRSALTHRRVEPKDKVFIQQAENAQRSGHVFDFDVRKGHDDVFMAGLLGWIAREQYPPPPRTPGSRKPIGGPGEERKVPFTYLDDATLAQSLQGATHLTAIDKWMKRRSQPDRLGEL